MRIPCLQDASRLMTPGDTPAATSPGQWIKAPAQACALSPILRKLESVKGAKICLRSRRHRFPFSPPVHHTMSAAVASRKASNMPRPGIAKPFAHGLEEKPCHQRRCVDFFNEKQVMGMGGVVRWSAAGEESTERCWKGLGCPLIPRTQSARLHRHTLLHCQIASVIVIVHFFHRQTARLPFSASTP